MGAEARARGVSPARWGQIPMQHAFLPLAFVNGCSKIWNKS